MGEHVLAVFALVGTQNKCASDRRSSDPVQVVKYGAGWYQRMSRVACRVSSVADVAAVKSRSRWQSWAKMLFARYVQGKYCTAGTAGE